MKLKFFTGLLVMLPVMAVAAERDAGSRVGVRRAPMMSIVGVGTKAQKKPTVQVAETVQPQPQPVDPTPVVSEEPEVAAAEESTLFSAEECKAKYRDCMDEFCLLDESEGSRCDCSDNIKMSKTLIQEIQSIQNEAEKLYTEGVEKERLGAKAKYIFGESAQAKKSSRRTGIDLTAWINGSANQSLGADDEIGDNLYDMAAEACEYVLAQCEEKHANVEEKLYQREIARDCKAFDSYLAEQKAGAESNKRTAEAAVRAAKVEMFGTTNKYNRGECLDAMRACVADKGGCGVNFENCMDKDLLARRTNSCENILDQCMEVRDYVMQDWAAESKMLLADAEKYVEENFPQTCNAKTENCLEVGCSVSTDPMCLVDINVAAGICPVIEQCDAKVPGFKKSWQTKLGALRTKFCQNDVDVCLQDKCGKNYTAPQCIGKTTAEITKLCPQSMFPSCKGEKQFNIIVSAALLQMDYQMLEGCKNYYADMLGRVCGTDMNCLPNSKLVASLTKLPESKNEKQKLFADVEKEAKKVLDEFFTQFDSEKTVAECRSSQQPKNSGRKSLKDAIFIATKQTAEMAAKLRYDNDLRMKFAELARAADVETARQECLENYKVESKPANVGEKDTYSYISKVSFEPSLRNCHVCRKQRVCETGGESKAASALKAGTGGIVGGASMGTMANAGWGTLIGAGIGGAIGALGGYFSGGEETYCQELESCEDINY